MAIRTLARPRGVGVVLAALGVLVFLAGCGGSDEGTATPSTGAGSATTATATPSGTATATATPSPTETSALPPLPEAAKQNTPEGAEAFIRYYFDVANAAYTTPKAGLLPGLSDADCVACRDIERQVAGLVEAKQRVRVPPFEIGALSAIGGGAPGVTSFNAAVRQPANEFLSADQQVVRESAALEKSGVIAAIWEGDRWLLYDSAVE